MRGGLGCRLLSLGSVLHFRIALQWTALWCRIGNSPEVQSSATESTVRFDKSRRGSIVHKCRPHSMNRENQERAVARLIPWRRDRQREASLLSSFAYGPS